MWGSNVDHRNSPFLARSDTPNITLVVSWVARSDTPDSCDAMSAKSNPPHNPAAKMHCMHNLPSPIKYNGMTQCWSTPASGSMHIHIFNKLAVG